MAVASEDEAIRRAREEGRIAQRIEMRLGDHDAQISALRASVQSVNGQLERLFTLQDALSDKIDDLSTKETIRNETNEGIRKALQEANDKQITTRQFVFGVIGIILTIIGLVLSQAHIFGGGHSSVILPHLLALHWVRWPL